jgi:putative salt-induced outer membrane protein
MNPRLFLVILLWPLAVQAEEEPKLWSADVELGAVFTSGNTDQESINMAFDAKRSTGLWAHRFHVDTLQASQDGDDTADKVYLFYRISRELSEKSSMFARLAYEDDKFSGFDDQTDLTVGYSRILMNEEKFSLTADAGVGAKRTSLETGESETETLLRLSGEFAWQISPSARLLQNLAFEIGEDLTTSRSETALESQINGSLAMKLAYKVKHSSEVLDGKKKTDSEATVSLVYKL